MKLVNLLKSAAWAVVIVSLLSIVWILSGIYHRPDGKKARAAAAPVPAPDYEIETVYEVGQKLLMPRTRSDDPDYAGWNWCAADCLRAFRRFQRKWNSITGG